jgi:signal transduction histidine kinase/CheY-like chemotaxis protein
MTASARGVEGTHGAHGAPGRAQPGAAARPEPAERAAGASAVGAGRVERPRVLFVDDEAKTHAIAEDILGMAGYDIDAAADGREALERFRPGVHAAVVTDIRMPRMSGIELLERIRERDPEVPVVITTGHATVETATRAVAAGAHEYLLKPVDFDRLKATLARAIERRRLAEENRRLVASLAEANGRLERLSHALEAEVRARTQELHEEKDLLEHVFAAIPSGIAVLGPAVARAGPGQGGEGLDDSRAGPPGAPAEGAGADASGGRAREPEEARGPAVVAGASDVFDDSAAIAAAGSPVRAFLRAFRERTRGGGRRLVSSNRAFERLGGAGRDLLRRVESDVASALAGGPPVIGRELVVRDAASGADWALRVSVASLAGGRALVVADDVTESARMEDELVQMEKLLSLGTLAGGIVHDLASPLTAVLGTAEILATLDQTDEQRGHVDSIVESAQYMRDICQGLLDFARKARSGASMTARVEEVVERALAFARHGKKLGKVEVVRALEEGLPPVAASPSELLQVVVNLVGNACDAMLSGPRGGGRLAVRASRAGGAARIAIADDGPGIPEAARESLFAPFFTTKGPGKGTGLGLFTSRRIVKRLGGTIDYETGPGGTTFIVEVPLAEIAW